MWMNLFTAALQAELLLLVFFVRSLFFPVNKNPDEKFAPRTLHPFFMLSWTRKCREPSLLDHPLTSRRSQDHLANSTDFSLISIWRFFLFPIEFHLVQVVKCECRKKMHFCPVKKKIWIFSAQIRLLCQNAVGEIIELLMLRNVPYIVNSQSMENLVNVTSNLPWKKVGVVPINFPEVCEYWNVPVQLWPPFPLASRAASVTKLSQKPKTDTHMDF